MTRKAIPHLKDAIAYVESVGYTFSHVSVIRSYVFYRNSDHKELAFTLPEIRDALKGGF